MTFSGETGLLSNIPSINGICLNSGVRQPPTNHGMCKWQCDSKISWCTEVRTPKTMAAGRLFYPPYLLNPLSNDSVWTGMMNLKDHGRRNHLPSYTGSIKRKYPHAHTHWLGFYPTTHAHRNECLQCLQLFSVNSKRTKRWKQKLGRPLTHWDRKWVSLIFHCESQSASLF